MYFNEIIDADGNIRDPYVRIYPLWKSATHGRSRLLRRRATELFSGDYAQDHLPRVLTHAEFKLLERGVTQRARAILTFLEDYSSRGRRWSQVIPPRTFNSIVGRHHVENCLRKIAPGALAFPYGPDIIRDHSGHWRVMEDSAGFIGGMGDIFHGRRILYRLMPEFREAFSAVNDPLDFFTRLANHFSREAEKKGGIPLLYLRSFSEESDQETRRLAQVFERSGIQSTTSTSHTKKLIVESNGFFLRTPKGRHRVGALVVQAGPEQFDARMFRLALNRLRTKRDATQSNAHIISILQSLHAPPIKSALIKGLAWTNFSPGVQFVNDKMFGLFVDSMILRFLKETPILKSVSAKPFTRWSPRYGWRIDHSMLQSLRRNKDQYVVKKVDEDGGSGVWIGSKLSRENFNGVLERVLGEPDKYIVQEFEHLSVLQNRIVDLRIHAHVDQKQIIVSNTPWGRANWIRGNGKVNILANGFTSPVLVLKAR